LGGSGGGALLVGLVIEVAHPAGEAALVGQVEQTHQGHLMQNLGRQGS